MDLTTTFNGNLKITSSTTIKYLDSVIDMYKKIQTNPNNGADKERLQTKIDRLKGVKTKLMGLLTSMVNSKKIDITNPLIKAKLQKLKANQYKNLSIDFLNSLVSRSKDKVSENDINIRARSLKNYFQGLKGPDLMTTLKLCITGMAAQYAIGPLLGMITGEMLKAALAFAIANPFAAAAIGVLGFMAVKKVVMTVFGKEIKNLSSWMAGRAGTRRAIHKAEKEENAKLEKDEFENKLGLDTPDFDKLLEAEVNKQLKEGSLDKESLINLWVEGYGYTQEEVEDSLKKHEKNFEKKKKSLKDDFANELEELLKKKLTPEELRNEYDELSADEKYDILTPDEILDILNAKKYQDPFEKEFAQKINDLFTDKTAPPITIQKNYEQLIAEYEEKVSKACIDKGEEDFKKQLVAHEKGLIKTKYESIQNTTYDSVDAFETAWDDAVDDLKNNIPDKKLINDTFSNSNKKTLENKIKQTIKEEEQKKIKAINDIKDLIKAEMDKSPFINLAEIKTMYESTIKEYAIDIIDLIKQCTDEREAARQKAEEEARQKAEEEARQKEEEEVRQKAEAEKAAQTEKLKQRITDDLKNKKVGFFAKNYLKTLKNDFPLWTIDELEDIYKDIQKDNKKDPKKENKKPPKLTPEQIEQLEKDRLEKLNEVKNRINADIRAGKKLDLQYYTDLSTSYNNLFSIQELEKLAILIKEQKLLTSIKGRVFSNAEQNYPLWNNIHEENPDYSTEKIQEIYKAVSKEIDALKKAIKEHYDAQPDFNSFNGNSMTLDRVKYKYISEEEFNKLVDACKKELKNEKLPSLKTEIEKALPDNFDKENLGTFCSALQGRFVMFADEEIKDLVTKKLDERASAPKTLKEDDSPVLIEIIEDGDNTKDEKDPKADAVNPAGANPNDNDKKDMESAVGKLKEDRYFGKNYKVYGNFKKFITKYNELVQAITSQDKTTQEGILKSLEEMSESDKYFIQDTKAEESNQNRASKAQKICKGMTEIAKATLQKLKDGKIKQEDAEKVIKEGLKEIGLADLESLTNK